MKRHLQYLLNESFIPVLLVILSLFVILLWVQYRIESEVNDIRIIEIPKLQNTAFLGLEDDNQPSIFFQPSLKRAEELIKQGKISQALTLYQDNLESSRNSKTLAEYAALLIQTNQWLEAKNILDEALRTEPVNPSAWFYRALLYSKQGHEKNAIKDYAKLLKAIPNHYEGNLNLALLHFKASDFTNAKSILQSTANRVGGSRKSVILYYLGRIYKKQKDVNRARSLFNQAIRLKPDYIAARLQLAALDNNPKNKQEYDQSLQQFAQIMELKPNYAPAYFHLAKLHSNAGYLTEAVKAYQRAIQFDPSYYNARRNLALLYMRQKNWSLAKEQFSWLLEHNPQDAKNHFSLGSLAYALRNYESAIDHYKNAIQTAGGTYPEAYLNLGLAYRRLKQTQNALKYYNLALEQDPNYSSAYYNIALLYMREKKWQQAEDNFKLALKFNNKYAKAWFNLAILYSKTNKNHLAIKAYQTALKIKPNYRSAQLNLAVRHAKNKNFKQAIELYKQVLLHDPTYSLAWRNLGIAYGKINDHRHELDAFEQAFKLEPDSSGIRLLLAKSMVANNLLNKALPLFSEIIEMQPDSIEARLEYIKALHQSGDIDKSREEYKKVELIDPNNLLVKQTYQLLFNEAEK